MTTELTTRQTTPAVLLELAVNQNADIDKLEKLMELQIRWEENEARKAYHSAMAAFKADPPEITKDRHVSYNTSKGNIDYKHSSLSNVTNTINKALSKHGLSASWKTAQTDGNITVKCTITHVNGYSESTTLSAAPDSSGGKNSIQAIGSTVSYLERYTILAATGLASTDMDDDGVGAVEPEYISESMVADIKIELDELKVDIPKFLSWLKVDAIEKIPVSDIDKVMTALTSKREALNADRK